MRQGCRNQNVGSGFQNSTETHGGTDLQQFNALLNELRGDTDRKVPGQRQLHNAARDIQEAIEDGAGLPAEGLGWLKDAEKGVEVGGKFTGMLAKAYDLYEKIAGAAT
ncbi:MAG: hypothetical protein ABW185_13830 [Sedimenticola sp.]